MNKKNLASFEVKQEALTLAHNLLRTKLVNVTHDNMRDVNVLNKLVERLTSPSDRSKVTYHECMQVITIANRHK